MRSVTLFTGQWADLPIEQLAGACAEWGFDGLELACWGDHFEVERAIAEPGYPGQRRSLLERHGLGCWAIGAHLVARPSAIRSTSVTARSCRPRCGGTATQRGFGDAPPSG